MGNEDVYSVLREIGPSAADAAATDQEALARLRAETKVWNTEKAGQGFVTLEGNCQFLEWHPSQLPSCFFLRKPPLLFLRKPPQAQGFWERKEGHRIAIRSDGVSRSHIPCRPDYIGMKSVLEFHLPDSTKTDWLMVEYRLFDNGFVEDDLVWCKVFQLKRKGPAPSDDAAAQLPNQVPLHPTRSSSLPTNPEAPFDVDELFSDFDFNDHNIGVPGPLSGHTGLSIEDYIPLGLPSSGLEGQHWENKEPVAPNEVQLVRKRSRSSGNGKSEVWNYFTKIRTKDPEVVYAACHYCDRMLKAHPKDGTSHLKRHTEKCSGKMRLNQPS